MFFTGMSLFNILLIATFKEKNIVTIVLNVLYLPPACGVCNSTAAVFCSACSLRRTRSYMLPSRQSDADDATFTICHRLHNPDHHCHCQHYSIPRCDQSEDKTERNNETMIIQEG